MLMWVSFQSTPQLLLGGTLHAIPAIVELLVLSDIGGNLSIPFPWPPGVPPGTNFWIQYLVQDLSVTPSIILSNAVKATTP
jgi:hypothetical protein